MFPEYKIRVFEKMILKGVKAEYAFDLLEMQPTIADLKPLELASISDIEEQKKWWQFWLNGTALKKKALQKENESITRYNRSTQAILSEYERILKTVPQIAPEKFTLHHPDLADQIEEAFECGLIRYYRFKSEFRLPTGRYKYHYKYLQLNAIKTDPELLKSEVQEARSWLSGERKKIDIGNAMQVLYKIETRASLPFDPELARKLASVSYFTDDEDLSTFDEEHGEKKIAHWKEHNFNDFFLMTPVAELLNLKNISITSLEAYLTEAQEILQALTLETPK